MNGVVNMSGARDPPPNLLIHQIIVRLLLIEFCDVRLRIAGTPDRVRQGIGHHPDRSCARRDPPGPDSRSVIDHASFGHGASLDFVFSLENSLQYVTRPTDFSRCGSVDRSCTRSCRSRRPPARGRGRAVSGQSPARGATHVVFLIPDW